MNGRDGVQEREREIIINAVVMDSFGTRCAIKKVKGLLRLSYRLFNFFVPKTVDYVKVSLGPVGSLLIKIVSREKSCGKTGSVQASSTFCF